MAEAEAAQTFFAHWFWRTTHSRLAPMAVVAQLIRCHRPNVLTYVRHGPTNAGMEAINITIQWVRKPLEVFATSSLSKPRSISIVGAWISKLQRQAIGRPKDSRIYAGR